MSKLEQVLDFIVIVEKHPKISIFINADKNKFTFLLESLRCKTYFIALQMKMERDIRDIRYLMK